ncbi:hypothetical protein HPB51_028991 [Rhipicephalus microplus]|uniref:Pancreatic trypsin inhibitor n=1 Tax=Rhipicephalus microplus TaxID=6941 RepID=A0A9J6CVH8_RHIMP|nr:hypothetical protein HPB51_028991 [Rhipicephalus microplus]
MALVHQQIEPRCLEPVQMTLCPVNASRWPSFFFDGRHCLTPVSVPPPGCLEGTNRFHSLGHCRAACQGQGARAECREPVHLVSCRREHVKRSWFYPANGSCVEWGFPEGSCVNVRLRLFQSMQQCLLDCVQHDAPACREYPGQGARAECREPVRLVSCRREHVKRSWFYPANGSCVEWGFPEAAASTCGCASSRACSSACSTACSTTRPPAGSTPSASDAEEYPGEF